jgi:two-component system cell cycle sensor histidine kinase/response regulator CckA
MESPLIVIVLEDDPLCMRVIVKTLKKAGYDPLSATSCEQALEVCRNRECSIHALIADLVLPGKHGTEAALRMAALCPGLKILFVSGTPIEGWEIEDIARLNKLPKGTVEFIAKPFQPTALLKKLNQLLCDGAAQPA